MGARDLNAAVAAVEKHGALLVFPIDNRKEPLSIWSVFYPRTAMKWEWDDEGDDRVSRLWHLRTELAQSRKVVYAKWYQGRATVFSREVFTLLLAALGSARSAHLELSRESRNILELLESDSPRSTKELKRATELVGKALESTYERALRSLWQKLLVVGFGEFDDGAFPSLAVGSSRLLFEDLWTEAQAIDAQAARLKLREKLGDESPFYIHLEKSLAKINQSHEARR